METRSNPSKCDENYVRKHEVIWCEDFLLSPSGCKSWPNNYINPETMKTRFIKWSSASSKDYTSLHSMLNEIKNAIVSLDYSDARIKAIDIYNRYKSESGIEDAIQNIEHKMQHIGKPGRFFTADDIDRLMLFAEFNGSKREQYSREYDRILVTKSFRHLQYKTQIMVNSASDDQRTRLLHSLEVQRIAKALATQLGANINLVQTIAIGHDVGHAPFGHAGERALSDCLSKGYYGDFSHALQSVKVLNSLEKHPIVKRYGFDGLGLSVEVLSGILKHDTDTFYQDVSCAAFRLQYDCPEVLNYCPGKAPYLKDCALTMGTLEAQIVYWADKIAYIGHDWEEFVLSSHIEKLLYDMNEIWDKIENVAAIYKNNKDRIEKAQVFEFEKLYEIHNTIEAMCSLFYEESNAAPTDEPMKSNMKLKENLINLIDELQNTKGEMLHPAKNNNETSKGKDNENTCDDKAIYTILSRNEYKMLFDYFKVAKAWICITERIPKKYQYYNDIVYIIYRFFIDTISQRTTPKFETDLLKNTRKNIENLDEQMIVVQSMEAWDTRKSTTNMKDKMDAKEAFMESLIVTLSDEMRKNLKIVDDFKFQYYVGSKEVQHMTDKASLMIHTLFDHYLNYPEMLPDKYLEEYCLLVDGKYNDYEKLLVDYLVNEYKKVRGCKTTICESDNNQQKIQKLFEETDAMINESKKNSRATLSDGDAEDQGTDPTIKAMKKLKKIASSFFGSDNEEEAKISLCIKGRQKNLFSNEWTEQNEKVIPFKLGNHVGKTILAGIIADYISSMTDRMAISKYNEVTSSSTSWTEKYNA